MIRRKFQKNELSADLSTCIAPLWNEGNILSFGYDLSEGLIQKNPKLMSKFMPLKITIDIPIIISYIIRLQHLGFEL